MTDDEWEEKVVVVFISSSALATNPKAGIPLPWIKVIQHEVDHGHVALCVVNEAHHLSQSGRHLCA